MSARHRIIWTEVAIADVEGIVDYVAERDSASAAERLWIESEKLVGLDPNFAKEW